MKKLMVALCLSAFAMLSTPAAFSASTQDLLTNPVCHNASDLAGCSGATNNQCKYAANEALCRANADDLGARGGYLTLVIDIFLFASAAVSVIFLLVGAIRYIASTGDSKRIQQAKDTILYAIIGLIVTILARAIVGFVIGRLT